MNKQDKELTEPENASVSLPEGTDTPEVVLGPETRPEGPEQAKEEAQQEQGGNATISVRNRCVPPPKEKPQQAVPTKSLPMLPKTSGMPVIPRVSTPTLKGMKAPSRQTLAPEASFDEYSPEIKALEDQLMSLATSNTGAEDLAKAHEEYVLENKDENLVRAGRLPYWSRLRIISAVSSVVLALGLTALLVWGGL